MEENTTNHGREPLSAAHIDEQLARLLEPLGVKVEAPTESEQRSHHTMRGEVEAHFSVSYLHLRCRNTRRLSLLASVMTLLNDHLGEANCVAHAATGKQQEGYLVFASTTPFPESITSWIGALEDVTDWYCHTVALDLDME
jgi:hypothetical protein